MDQQAARWRLNVLKSTKEPDTFPMLLKNKNNKPRLIQPTKDTEESNETLTSELESGQAGLGVNKQRSQPNVYRVHYKEPIVILDNEPEVNSKGLAMSGPIGLQVESSRSTGNLAAYHGLVTGFSTEKADSSALVSSLNLEPNTATCQNNGLNSIKRKGPEDQGQPRAKRPKPIEVIELSNDDENKVSTQELGPVSNISGNNGSHELYVEFGGQHANRHITEDDWARSELLYPTECTCIKSGDTYKIATRMPSLPTICVVPPTAMRFWAAKFCKILDITHKVATHLRLSVRHNDYTKDQQLYHEQDHVQLTAEAAVRQLDDDDGEGQLLVGGRPTLSNWLVLVSWHSATKLYAMYDNMSSRASNENKNIYNGTLDSPTNPFRFLRSLRETSVNEPIAFTVSASIPLSGPIQMANIVDHVLRSRYLQGQKERIRGVNNAQSLKVAQTNYKYLLDNLNRGTDEKTKTKLQDRQETLDKLEKELRGPEPTQRSIEAGLFGSGKNNNVAARMNRTSKKAWIRLIRAGVYPFLAHLLDTSVFEDDDLHHEAVNQLGVAACKAYFTEGRDEMYVDDMLSYRSWAPTADDPGPRDGMNIRHMIVLTQLPSSAFITYMLLAHAYRGNVKVVLFNAATKNDANASDNGYGRNQILDDLNSPCNQLSPNKIIISTYRICEVVLNLQRANYCIIMEPAGSTEAERQAAARVNRRGQESRPVTAMLYNEHNFAESLRLSWRANHDKILKNIVEITQHPILGPTVRTLEICTDHFHQSPNSYFHTTQHEGEIILAIQEDRYLPAVIIDRYPPGEKEGQSPREEEQEADEGSPSLQDTHTAPVDKVAYKSLWEEQKQIIIPGLTQAYITQALIALTNAEAVVISNIHRPWGALVHSRQTGRPPTNTVEDFEAVPFIGRILHIALTAIATSGAALRSLAVTVGLSGETITPDILRLSEAHLQYHKSLPPNLTELTLNISAEGKGSAEDR
ncbi:hypothetical protein NPX13_g7721 [Xylaria arbuscula]|uniref:Helicase C-terminal domain-containing protein n=1 Tax=Xylaria arbuscula TaxID=114810 RepID=A0A9W8NA46_9PEZI|nr:hypothetical protein NPX13_g7721 [Xylaria arbuscula]